MTQTDKDLLIKDLCSRLPYGVMAKFGDSKPLKITNIGQFQDSKSWFIESEFESGTILGLLPDIKPYLFPISSMTIDQAQEWHKYANDRGGLAPSTDWLNAHHFDYRGLIPMGLANDATGLNIY